jgi:uncharacterized protein
MNTKKTLVIGASTNPERYAYLAINSLRKHGHEVVAIGRKEGIVNDVQIQPGKPDFEDIDTVTLYLNPAHQADFHDYVLDLKPKRILFNPGAENPEFMQQATVAGIEALEACTLVLLSTGQF